MKVLIIDDNEETTTMLSKFLNSRGYTTVVSNDPLEGLYCIQRERFDVVLLDISMPEFSGLQIVSTLATDEILQDQNIFIYSANFNNDVEIKNLLRRDGINGCLKKPMNLEKIVQVISGPKLNKATLYY